MVFLDARSLELLVKGHGEQIRSRHQINSRKNKAEQEALVCITKATH